MQEIWESLERAVQELYRSSLARIEDEERLRQEELARLREYEE